MRLDGASYALAPAAMVTVGLSGCGNYPSRADATTSKQLAAAGDLVKARNINVDTIRGVVQLNSTAP